MTTVIITLLVGLTGYLGTRLHAATTENSDLKKSIAMLKRRIGRE